MVLGPQRRVCGKTEEGEKTFIDSITIVSGQTPGKTELGEPQVKGGGEMYKLETEFYISSRPCSDSCKYSLSYFNHMNRLPLGGRTHIRFQVNNLAQRSIHSEISSCDCSNSVVRFASFHMATK